jgi:hypothetical protein
MARSPPRRPAAPRSGVPRMPASGFGGFGHRPPESALRALQAVVAACCSRALAAFAPAVWRTIRIRLREPVPLRTMRLRSPCRFASREHDLSDLLPAAPHAPGDFNLWHAGSKEPSDRPSLIPIEPHGHASHVRSDSSSLFPKPVCDKTKAVVQGRPVAAATERFGAAAWPVRTLLRGENSPAAFYWAIDYRLIAPTYVTPGFRSHQSRSRQCRGSSGRPSRSRRRLAPCSNARTIRYRRSHYPHSRRIAIRRSGT